MIHNFLEEKDLKLWDIVEKDPKISMMIAEKGSPN